MWSGERSWGSRPCSAASSCIGALAQFRRHVGQPEVAVEVVLARARHVAPAVGQPGRRRSRSPRPVARACSCCTCASVPVCHTSAAPDLVGRGEEHFDWSAFGRHRDSARRAAEHGGLARQAAPARPARRRAAPPAPWPAASRGPPTARSAAGCRGASVRRWGRRFVELLARRTMPARAHGRAKCQRMTTTCRLSFCLDSRGRSTPWRNRGEDATGW